MDDRADSSTLSVEDKQNGLEFARAALREGGSTEAVFTARGEEALDHHRAAYRSQATENRNAALLDLHHQQSGVAEPAR